MLDPGSWIRDTGFWILDPGSWIQDPGSWIQDPGSILDPGSWILEPGSRILDPGSWIQDHGSVIQDPGSVVCCCCCCCCLLLLLLLLLFVVVCCCCFALWDRFMSLGLLASAVLEKHHKSFELFASKLSSAGLFHFLALLGHFLRSEGVLGAPWNPHRNLDSKMSKKEFQKELNLEPFGEPLRAFWVTFCSSKSG